MIILGKDKIDERYNIDDNGVITELQGNVQEVKISRGRPIFKHQGIHKILMWTKYGYRDTKIWCIHHLDENKLNNNINNLKFVTKSEHMKIHSPGKEYRFTKNFSPWNKGKTYSDEQREKLKGHKFSEETKKKMSESHKGKIPWNKGLSLSNETKNKISQTLKDKKHLIPIWNKGKTNIYTNETKNKMSIAHKGKHWKKDPITGKRIYY